MKNFGLFLLLAFLASCSASKRTTTVVTPSSGNAPNKEIKSQVKLKNSVKPVTINTKGVDPDDVITYAEMLVGVPYVFGGTTLKGMDCSGFLFYVFNKFGIKVPRISREYAFAGKTVSSLNSKRGDLILFTGSNPKSGEVGHLGIIIENKNGVIRFIHSASGGRRGVSISGMNSYFLERYIKIIRIFS
jgi:cell wall-associated NlpC family hydrolase